MPAIQGLYVGGEKISINIEIPRRLGSKNEIKSELGEEETHSYGCMAL